MNLITEQELMRSLGRIEGRFDGVEKKLGEIHDLSIRVEVLEKTNNRLYGALTIIGILWSAAVAAFLKVIHGK